MHVSTMLRLCLDIMAQFTWQAWMYAWPLHYAPATREQHKDGTEDDEAAATAGEPSDR